jgi:8-oxo-dGTP diphosphatase
MLEWCGALIVNEKNEVLFQLRGSNTKNRAGYWTIPGGTLEFGELFHDAVKREIKEELNIDIEISALLCLVDDIIPEEKQHWVTPQYLAHIVSGEPTNMEPHKCDNIGWFSFDALPQPLTPMTTHAVKVYLERHSPKPL